MKECAVCGSKINKGSKKYCSKKCFYISKKGPTKKLNNFCIVCNELIKKHPSITYKQYYERKYCSKKCFYLDRKGKLGKKHTEETKKKISKNHHNIFGVSNPMYGKKHSKNAKKKMRLASIKRIENNYGEVFPSYNKTACEYFKKFDEENNTQGRYAVYGGGEFYIKELGYFPDYINFDLKLIIEWDEKYHNKQKEKDIQRQKEIMELYPDFKFKRIKQKIDME